DAGVGSGNHRVDEVELAHQRFAVLVVRANDLPRFHRTARDEDGGQVQAHCRQQHTRRDLVAIRNADQGVGAVCIDHVLDAVGDEFAAGQRIQHAVVAHCDAIVHGNRVELDAPATRGIDDLLDPLPHVVQVHVPGYELGEAV